MQRDGNTVNAEDFSQNGVFHSVGGGVGHVRAVVASAGFVSNRGHITTRTVRRVVMRRLQVDC